MNRSRPERGEVWFADLDPVARNEQGGIRSVLVMSTGQFNAWPIELVVVVPITSRDRGFDHHVGVVGGGLDRPSFAMPEYVRSVTQTRLRRRLGVADQTTVDDTADWLRRIVGM